MAQLFSFLNRRRSASAPALFSHSSLHSSSSRFPPNPISSHSHSNSSTTFPPNPIANRSSSSTTFPPNPISTSSSSSATFPPNPMSTHSSPISSTISTHWLYRPTEEDQSSGGNTGAGDISPISSTISTHWLNNWLFDGPTEDQNSGGTHWLTRFLLPEWLFPRPAEIENPGDRWGPAPAAVGNIMVTMDCTQFGFAMREDVTEIFTVVVLFFSFIVGWLSTAFPNENKKIAKFRCIGVIVSSLILFILNVLKINLEVVKTIMRLIRIK